MQVEDDVYRHYESRRDAAYEMPARFRPPAAMIHILIYKHDGRCKGGASDVQHGGGEATEECCAEHHARV